MISISMFQRYAMWFCAACFYGFQFILRVSPGVIVNDLMDSLLINACTLGTVISFYYTGYSIMQVPTGLILDRLGVRGPLSIACLLCAFGCLIFKYGESTLILSLGRALMGIGSAFGFLSCLKVASQNFTPQQMAFFVSLTMTVGTIGGSGGGAPFAYVTSLIGWREAYKFLAIAGGVLMIFVLIVFHNSATVHHTQHKTTARSESILPVLATIVSNPQTWIYGLYGFMMYVPLAGFVDLWIVPYIQAVFHVDKTVAGGVGSMAYVGSALGATFWSYYVARVQSYRKGMFWSAVSTGVLITLVIYLPLVESLKEICLKLTYVLMGLAGAAMMGQFVSFAGVSELNPHHRTATACGMHNMLCMSSGIVMMPLIGKILDIIRDSLHTKGLSYHAGEDYQIALIFIPLSILIALIAVAFIKESYPKIVEKSCK